MLNDKDVKQAVATARNILISNEKFDTYPLEVEKLAEIFLELSAKYTKEQKEIEQMLNYLAKNGSYD